MGLESVHITLSAQELQTVLGALDELPGKITRPIHNSISEQVRKQLLAEEAARNPPPAPEPPAPPPAPAVGPKPAPTLQPAPRPPAQPTPPRTS